MKQRFTKAADLGLASCHTCGLVSPIDTNDRCPRCDTKLELRGKNCIQNSIALMSGAALLYIPSHMLPILTVTEFGTVSHNTIIGGMITFWESGAYPIAIVIFTASILIPILKIAALIWLCAAATGKAHPSPKALGRIYLLTELLGRWSMVDIFVVGILVSLVQLGNYMTILPGPGALAFAAVVMLTMFAAMSFDPRLLWDRMDELSKDSPPTAEPDSP